MCDVGRSSGEHVVLFSPETQSSLSQFFSSSTSLVMTTRSSTARGRTVMYRCSADRHIDTTHLSASVNLFASFHRGQRRLLHYRSVHCHDAHCSCLLT